MSNLIPKLIVLAVAIYCVPTRGSAATKAEDQWALLIGINRYDRMSDLKYCVDDVNALRASLIAAGFAEDHVIVLSDQAKDRSLLPTKNNIERELSILAEEKCDAGDTLLISFSGHGINVDGRSYLCVRDTNLDVWKTSTLPISNVLFTLNSSPAAVKMIVMDACRNELLPDVMGQFDLLGSLSSIRAEKSELPQGLIVMASCLAGQISIEDEQLKQGVFMHYVCEGLNGSADYKVEGNRDGMITPDELFEYAAERTQVRSVEQHGWAQQPWRVNESTARVEIARVPPERKLILASATVEKRDDLTLAMHQQARQYYSQAVSALGRGDLPAVIKLCTNAIKHDPEFKNAYHLRGMSFQLSGNLKAAINDFQKAGQTVQVPYPSGESIAARVESKTTAVIHQGDILEVQQLMSTKSANGVDMDWAWITSVTRNNSQTGKLEQIDVNGFVRFSSLPRELTPAQRAFFVRDFQQQRQIPLNTYAYHDQHQYSQHQQRQQTANTLNKVATGLYIANQFGANTGGAAGVVGGVGAIIGNGSGSPYGSNNRQFGNFAAPYARGFLR
ncbi:MAG: caspase family protein [Planctomycetota bacterium]|nr:caspase family protein [Planctomycetota bacterium]